MLKKIAVVGALSIFGYAIFKRVFCSDVSTMYGGHTDSGTTSHEIDHDE